MAARVLDDASSQIWETDYNTNGFGTARRDPVGHETTYTYDTNETTCSKCGRPRPAVAICSRSTTTTLPSIGPSRSRTRPEITTTFTYNTTGQVLTITNPLSETTTYAYDQDGYLSSVTAPIESAQTT